MGVNRFKKPNSQTAGREGREGRKGFAKDAKEQRKKRFLNLLRRLRNLCGRLRFIVLSLEQSDEILPI